MQNQYFYNRALVHCCQNSDSQGQPLQKCFSVQLVANQPCAYRFVFWDADDKRSERVELHISDPRVMTDLQHRQIVWHRISTDRIEVGYGPVTRVLLWYTAANIHACLWDGDCMCYDILNLVDPTDRIILNDVTDARLLTSLPKYHPPHY